MTTTNVILMWGGEGTEHEISHISAQYIQHSLTPYTDINVISVELLQNGQYKNAEGIICQLIKNTTSGLNEMVFRDGVVPALLVDFVIPCFHGIPGESGDIQSLFDLLNVPYLGCGAEASVLCFNKVTTKLWLNSLDIPSTPYIMLASTEPRQLDKAYKALEQWQHVFIKSSSQGSSVGCYQASDREVLKQNLIDAFNYSPYVLVEKFIKARELEVAVYEYNGETVVTLPGEILSPEGSFYTYEEKYDKTSSSVTEIVAKNIPTEQIETIKRYALNAFTGLKLKHLSRIDFFLTEQGEVLINEINTFPGMTPISMFPKMMEHHGHHFSDFIVSIIRHAVTA